MDTLSVRREASLPLTITSDDLTANTVTLTVKASVDDISPLFTKTVSFNDSGVADLTLTPTDTDVPVGEYIYMLTVVYDDASVDKFPDTSNCEDDECTFPEFIVCGALDSPEEA